MIKMKEVKDEKRDRKGLEEERQKQVHKGKEREGREKERKEEERGVVCVCKREGEKQSERELQK